VRRAVYDHEPHAEVLQRLQGDKALGRTRDQTIMISEDPVLYFNTVADNAQLDARERFILDKHFGISGERITFREMGERMGEIGWPVVKRQRVHALMLEAKERLGPEIWDALEKSFPEPVSESRIAREAARRRTKMLGYLRKTDEHDNLQYEVVHQKLGLPIPDHRIGHTHVMDEVQSCWAYMEDYGARNMGKYRYCTMCKSVKPAAGPLAEFYTMQNGQKYQICSTCNTTRCVRFSRTGDGTVEGRQVDCKKIDVHEMENQLPTLDDIRGIAPGATGDLTSEEFVRRMRDEEW
jgi:hypothetical protein